MASAFNSIMDKFVIKTGVVYIKEDLQIWYMDIDDEPTCKIVQSGFYYYRIVDFNGWKPQQIFVNGSWLDVYGECEEINSIARANGIYR